MTASQLMTAKSSAPADDFGAFAPPLSVPHVGEPVKIQASQLSDFLTSSPSNVQKKVDVSTEPAKLCLPWQTVPKPATPPAAATLPAPGFKKNWISSQEAVGAPPGVWQSPTDTNARGSMGAPPGLAKKGRGDPASMMLTSTERMNMAFANHETWLAETMQNYGFWPNACQNPWWGQQAMPEAWTSNCFLDLSAALPVPPPPAFNPTIEWAATPPAEECGRARYSSGESTELSGPGEFSRGFSTDDEWSSGKDTGNNSPDGNFDEVKFGRMLLSLLNSETSDAPSRNPVNECEAEQTCGAVSQESDHMPQGVPAPPPGLSLPTNFSVCTSAALEVVEPPPGLTLSAPIEEPQSSGDDADVSDAEAPESPCSPCTPPEPSVSETFACEAPKPAADVPSSNADQRMAAPRAAEVFCPPPIQVRKKTELPIQSALPAQRKVNKPRQQRVKAPAPPAEVAPEPSPALQKKAVDAAPAPAPEQAKPDSPKNKPRVEPKQPRTSSKTSSAAQVKEVEEVSDDDFTMLDKQISVRSSLVPWFLVPWFLALLALVFTMALFCCMGQWLDSGSAVELDSSLAYEVQQSTMVTPGASHAWAATTVPAFASAHIQSQTVVSLANKMDVEFARTKAVASYLKSKLNDVRIAMRAQRQEKERVRQFQQFQQHGQFKAQFQHMQFQQGPFQQGPFQHEQFQFHQGIKA